jgi:hypothetical protein
MYSMLSLLLVSVEHVAMHHLSFQVLIVPHA